MTRIITIAMVFTAGAAQAHPGHLAEVAGHGHWLGAAAIGAAIAIGLWAGRKRPANRAEAEDTPEGEDAPAQDA